MKKFSFSLFIVSVFFNPTFGQDSLRQSKIDDVSIFYTVIPFSRTYHLKNENLFGVQINLATKNKFSVGLFAFYGTNHLPPPKYNSQTKFNAATTQVQTGKIIQTSFLGTQIGFGTSLYYKFINRPKFFFASGINASVSFFSDAYSEYGLVKVTSDSLYNYYSIEKTSVNTNYDNFTDNLPDIFLFNFISKFQFSLSRRLKVFTEPFVSLIGIHKIHTYTLSNFGTNIGLTLKL